MKTKTHSKRRGQSRDTRGLRIVLDIEFEPGCPLSDPPEDVVSVEMQLDEGCCQTDFIIESDEPGDGCQVHHEVTERTDFDDCVCCIFRKYNCIPKVIKSTPGSTYIATYLQDRETGSELIEDLREVCLSVQLVQLTDNNQQIVSQIREVDMASLSEKQKEALQMASEAEYFDPGNGATLHELADQLGITSSALSQRISRAEAEILRQLFK